jgi:2-polyprenyl-6-hydroxyphenyl methylase / 3-demethylubiquinone-9 3-methyltransferase
VIAETARVLRPGGVYLFDTINRTRTSKFVMIKLFQDWRFTAWMPPKLHAWEQFITPEELRVAMRRSGLDDRDVVGIGPGVKPPTLIRLMRQLRKGRISHGEFGRRAQFVVSNDTRVAYAGYASKGA